MNASPSSASESAHELLRQAGLRQTACRQLLLTVLLDAGAPVPLARLEERVDGFDRVTIYRTLQSFLQVGLVHRTNDSAGHPHYAPNLLQGLRRSHAHFECQQCGRLLCFDWGETPAPLLPPGFALEDAELRLRGLCDRCTVV